jgi:hypothetical protein
MPAGFLGLLCLALCGKRTGRVTWLGFPLCLRLYFAGKLVAPPVTVISERESLGKEMTIVHALVYLCPIAPRLWLHLADPWVR